MRKRLKRVAAALMAVVFMSAFLSIAVSASGEAVTYAKSGYQAQKISNPTNGSGEVDGFLDGGDRMNSYPWSMGQTQDYVFVGGNRNILLASAMYGGELFTQFSGILDILTLGELPPMDFSDRAARLFMIDKKTNEIKLAYTSERDANGQPYDTGYRSANATFTLPGSDSESYFFGSTGANVTRIMRIDKGFDPDRGDKPVEVIRFEGKATIRAMTVHEDLLMFGVAVPSSGPVIYASQNPEGSDSWEIIGSATDFKGFQGTSDLLVNGFINDIISFNGSIYVAFSNSQSVQADSGFLIYKGTYDADNPQANDAGWIWEAIVADDYGKYDKGMGNMINVMGTFHKYTVNGKEYVYVGTASDPFTAIFPALGGDFDMIYNVITNPIELYRFDSEDNWELVAGNPETNKYFSSKTGNYYNGFDYDKNKKGSCEQYIWALEEHDGKLYIGTFDASTLLKYVTIGVDNEKLNEFFDMTPQEKESAVNNVVSVINSALEKQGKRGLSTLQTAAVKYALNAAIDHLGKIDVAAMGNGIQGAAAQITKYFDTVLNIAGGLLSVDLTQQILESSELGNLYKFVTLCNVVSQTQRGAGLYVTSDGDNFKPVTVNGFNDEYNWGVRNLVSTENGIYVGMANPFYGGQIWLLEETAPASVWSAIIQAALNFLKIFELIF